MTRFIPWVVILVVVALIAYLLYSLFGGGQGYTVKIVFPDSTNLNTGGLVEINGSKVGEVKHLSVGHGADDNGEAIVTISVTGSAKPLHEGTTASIQYKSLLGERYVELTPGPNKNAAIPGGSLIVNNQNDNSVVPRVELQSILNQLDPATRQKLGDLIPQFQQIFAGQGTQDTQATLQTAAPTITALTNVLEAVGSDGQTLHQLVSDMADLSTRLNTKQQSLDQTVSGLDTSMDAVAQETSELSEGINQLPSTLTAANQTLAMVPEATSNAVPLLNDLQTATTQLPQFSRDLEPVLTELKPVSAELVPTLNGLSNLLNYTPGLLNSVNTVVPQAEKTVSGLGPALNYLRPYSPELAGVFTNWGNWLGTYDTTGHVAPVPPTLGLDSLEGLLPSTLTNALGAAGVSGFNLDTLGIQGLIGTTNYDRGPGGLPGGDPTTDAAGNPVQ